MRTNLTLLFSLFLFYSHAQQISTKYVQLNQDGSLSYTPDEFGNTLIDHGMAGYRQGLQDIPNVATKITLDPGSGDRTADIQAAIDQIAGMQPDGNGHRGALLLRAGTYELSGVLYIKQSGIVIRGEGNGTGGTLLFHTGTDPVDVLTIGGEESMAPIESTKKNIVGSYVPFGTKTITVEAGHSFQAGDHILVTRAPNQAWIDLMGMGKLEKECGPGHHDWTPEGYTISSRHKVLKVNGNTLLMDVPIIDPIEQGYATGYVRKYTWTGIEECGVENIRFESKTKFGNDENHAKRAITTQHLRNGWFRQINAKDFQNNCVKVENSFQITVDDCEVERYRARTTGGRKYGFAINSSQLVLIKNCRSKGGRHCFAAGSRTAGPNVFYNCTSVNAIADNGPHHRWSTGFLWEGIVTDNQTNLQRRKCSGSGHGWTCGQNILWNCTAEGYMAVHDPPGVHQNYAIGCVGNVTNKGYDTYERGYVESTNNPIGFSLYEKQAENYRKWIQNPTFPEEDPIPSPPEEQLIANGLYNLKSLSNNQHVASGSDNNVFMANAAENANDQKWEIAHLGDNVYAIKNLGTQRFMVVRGAPCGNGANVGTANYANGSHQRWAISKEGNAYFLKPLHCTSHALDKNGGNSQNAHLWNFNAGNGNQQFAILPTQPSTGDPTPTPPNGNGNGLQATYFNNMDFSGSSISRIDPVIDFSWGGGAPDPQIGNDTYSARWEGSIEAPSSGNYTFYTTSDDGMKLWVNGQLIIDKWIDQGPTEWTGTLNMTAGQKVPIKLEYYENGGGAMAKLSWSGPGVGKQIVPQANLYAETKVTNPAPNPPSGGGNGLQAIYYDNMNFSGTSISRIDPVIDFNWGLGSPNPQIGNETYSVRWEGSIEAPTSGTYTFYSTTDDGVKLWINGQLIIEKWIDQAPREWTGTINMSAGQRVAFKMEYYENGGGAVAQLSWSGPGVGKQIVPSSQLHSGTNASLASAINSSAPLQEESSPSITLYPNPVQQYLSMDLAHYVNTSLEYTIYNIQGQKLRRRRIQKDHPQEVSIDVSALPRGIYLLSIQPDDYPAVTKRFIVGTE